MGVNLAGVVHERKGVKEFQPYLNSTVYLDEEVISTKIGPVINVISLDIDLYHILQAIGSLSNFNIDEEVINGRLGPVICFPRYGSLEYFNQQ